MLGVGKKVGNHRILSTSPVLIKRTLFASRRTHNVSALPNKEKTLAKFSFPAATCTIRDINRDIDEILKKGSINITLNGHIHKKPRIMATRSFAELRDANGDIIQILMSPEHTPTKNFELLKEATIEDSVSVSGIIQLKQSKAGEECKKWELIAQNYQVLNHSNLDAARLDKLKHSSPKDLPPQFRYLQLRTPFYQNSLRTRSKVANLIRNIFLENHDFVEIETPLLFKSTPEGAREFLVPTRLHDKFYALPQSPQQYKQILMSSGFTRYFQIAKCFRDEDLRADRQPEFTQVDLEMSYINNSDQVGLVVENLIHNIWNKIANLPTYRLNSDDLLEQINFEDRNTLAFTKLNYIEALSNYGIDKPDLRSSLKFKNITPFFLPMKNKDNFPILEVCILRDAFDPSKKTKVPNVLTDSNNYSKRKPIVLGIKSENDAQNWYQKFVDKNVIQTTTAFDETELNKFLGLKAGDILAMSTRSELPYENPTPLGKFRQLAIAEYPNKWKRKLFDKRTGDIIENYNVEEVFVGSWIVDFPLFNPVEISEKSDEFPEYDFTKFESTHHPFTMAKLEDYDLLASDPLKVRGEHYDLVINGVEVGGGSRRIHDPQLQKYIFENILKIQNYNELFGHLLHALSMGCPPHAGLALGFDRLCTMLVGSTSIRDVIAFPKNQSGIDTVVGSPSHVNEKTLNEYQITKIMNKDVNRNTLL